MAAAPARHDISIAGAGPAGLFAGVLLARNPRVRRVEIFEARVRPERGWGIVLSPRTLEAVAAADPECGERIRRIARSWEHLHVRGPGWAVTFAGHGYVALPRTALLALLACRLHDLGVPIRRGRTAPAADAEVLCVGADGARSATRAAMPGAVAEVTPGRSRYFWFGSTRRYDSHCFVFARRGDHAYIAHAYPHAERRSTFIVECGDAAWSAARFDQRDPCAACEELFAEELRGARLLSRDQRWSRFATVRVSRWWAGRTVLIGYAAHTAHFSIGSGTKLAMEDGIALDAAIRDYELADALEAYETRRRPAVERLQAAADRSRMFFEGLEWETAARWELLVTRLMTRSGRVGYAELAAASPAFAERLERGSAPVGATSRHAPWPSERRLRLGAHVLGNRLVHLVPAAGLDVRPPAGIVVFDLRDGDVPKACRGPPGALVLRRMACSSGRSRTCRSR